MLDSGCRIGTADTECQITDSSFKDISREVKFVNKIIKSVGEDESLFTVSFDRIDFLSLRVIEFRMPPFPGNIDNSKLLQYPYDLPKL